MIRQLISEILLQETSLADVVPERHRPQEVNWDYSTGGGLEYGDDVTTKYRRDVKRDWNKHALVASRGRDEIATMGYLPGTGVPTSRGWADSDL